MTTVDNSISMYLAAHRAMVADIDLPFPHNVIQWASAAVVDGKSSVANALNSLGIGIVSVKNGKCTLDDKKAIADVVSDLLDRVPTADLNDNEAMQDLMSGLHSVVNGMHCMEVLSTDASTLWVYTRLFLKLVSRLPPAAAAATAGVDSWLVQNIGLMNECYKDPASSEEASLAWTFMVEHVHPRIARALASACTDKDAYMAELCASVRAMFAQSDIAQDGEKHIAFLCA